MRANHPTQAAVSEVHKLPPHPVQSRVCSRDHLTVTKPPRKARNSSPSVVKPSTQTPDKRIAMAFRKNSLPWEVGTEFEKLQKRVNRLPINLHITSSTASRTANSTETLHSALQSGCNIFERYTDYGTVVSARSVTRTPTTISKDSELDTHGSSSSNSKRTQKHVPTAVMKSTKPIYDQLCRPTDHVHKAEFHDRQLYMYIVADATGKQMYLPNPFRIVV
ncbi:hypothetical protein EG68_10089 [Paragonimus skrjabini miyazakii]|uniref:Uncharacterized protein n=1 Tax=Paragonimus skrjabini miyazakii TaxID=59628 RepID=A0A8S9YLN7_9TREM|nr:hypothetical protein EG68_10089 [Paragonimus skrjabini miyazakii]